MKRALERSGNWPVVVFCLLGITPRIRGQVKFMIGTLGWRTGIVVGKSSEPSLACYDWAGTPCWIGLDGGHPFR